MDYNKDKIFPTIYFYPLLDSNIKIKNNIYNEIDLNKNNLLYIHIPYCLSHCLFCPFHTKVIKNLDEEINKYVDVLIKELEMIYKSINKKIKIGAIYYGGGSPSVLSIENLYKLHNKILGLFELDNVEITFEGELRTLSNKEYLKFLNELNIHRISFGVQTFNDKLRKDFNIMYDSSKAKELINIIQENTNLHINVDMMYGLPNQTIKELENDINEICSLNITSIDYYRLHYYSLPKNLKGSWIEYADQNRNNYLKFLINNLENNNFINVLDQVFSKDGLSKYNNMMWKQECNMIGIGTSARSYINGTSFMNTTNINKYFDDITNNKFSIQSISDKVSILERLRVFSPKTFFISNDLIQNSSLSYKQLINEWETKGWLNKSNTGYKVTFEGKLQVDNMVIKSMSSYQKTLVENAEKNLALLNNSKTGSF